MSITSKSISLPHISKNYSKFLSNATPIEIVPAEIVFRDIVPNQLYEMSVLVRNLTKIVRRIRVFQPRSSRFRCDYDMGGNLAAGLAIKLTVSFETSTLPAPSSSSSPLLEFRDTIKIVSDDNISIEIPMLAIPTCSQIIWEPWVNFGWVRVGGEKEEIVRFKNEGKKLGKVEIKGGVGGVEMDAGFFTIQPEDEHELKLIFKPKEAGILRGSLDVIVDGQSFSRKVELNGTSVEYNRCIIDESGLLAKNLNFGTLYFGEKMELSTFLVNNTPKPFKFKAKFRIGLQRDGKLDNLQTPNEVGYEQTEKIVTCTPDEGIIQAYSQLPIKFKCHPKINDKLLTLSRNYSLSRESSDLPPEEFDYSVFFEFENEMDPQTLLSLSVQGVLPKIKVSLMNGDKNLTPLGILNSLDFGQCSVNDYRDMSLILENQNEEKSIDFEFQRSSAFWFEPRNGRIPPNEQIEIGVSFNPKNLGIFNLDCKLFFLSKQYHVPMKLVGLCINLGEKQKKVRGLESLPESFVRERKTLDQTLALTLGGKEIEGMSKLLLSWENLTNSKELMERMYSQYSSKFMTSANPDELIYRHINRKIYNDFMRLSRFKREQKVTRLKIDQKMSDLNTKLKDLGVLKDKSILSDDDDNYNPSKKRSEAPIDPEFYFGIRGKGQYSPKLALPEKKDTLYVERPIANYEPFRVTEAQAFIPDPLAPLRKKFSSEPKSHKEIRDSNLELNGDMLQKVFAGPKQIDFGMLFVKSTVSRTFTVRNDLRNAIKVRLESELEELKKSYLKVQIVPAGEIATFEISICSRNPQEFKTTIRYIINERHKFEFEVYALIEPVTLEPDQLNMNFRFLDDNNEMEVVQKLTIKNKGNSAGRFRFPLSDNKAFLVEPKEGEVAPFSKTELKIIYKPTGTNPGKNEEERILMKVEDGLDQTIKCSGYALESKCVFLLNEINWGEWPVCQEKKLLLGIKNSLRHPTVYKIVEPLPPFVELTPMQDRLNSEETKYLKLSFNCKKELELSNETININVRGGKPLSLPFSIKTIIPDITINEEEFNFGGITTLGNPGELTLTISNSSSIAATLLLDLRETSDHEDLGYACLDISLVNQSNDEEEEENPIHSINEFDEKVEKIEAAQSAMKIKDSNHQQDNDSKHKNSKKSIPTKNIIEEDDEYLSDQSQSVEEEEKLSSRNYQIIMKPGKTLHFLLKFTPKEVKSYKFELPIVVSGYGPLESLNRTVKCRGLKPKLLIDPQIVDFKKKIISNDKFIPMPIDVMLSNPDINVIHFFIDTTELEKYKVFNVFPCEGVITGGSTVNLKATFNPYAEKDFEQIVPLYIDSDRSKGYLDIHLKGVGAYPKLTFDRREVILPIVPLGISAKCQFRMVNDGYENLTLKDNVADFENMGIKLSYLEGRNLGVTKNKIKLELSFAYNKPVSFTKKLDFYDNDGRAYSIPISGTTDNCLLTNYSFIQRQNPADIRIMADDGHPITITEDFSEANSEIHSKKGGGNSYSKAGSVKSSKSNRSILGYNPIPMNALEKSVDHILKWLNHFALSSTIQSFPEDVIQNHGSQIFELMTYLTNRQVNFKVKVDNNMKRGEKVITIVKQYEEFIKLLMLNGAFLNTIRPWYLLSYTEYLIYVKQNKNEYVHMSGQRLSENKYHYLSLDSWVTLFYQMIKIYALSKINSKSIKNLPNISPEKLLIPEYYLEGSNLYSQNEGIIIRWLELYSELMSPISKNRLSNFGNDLRDSLCFSYLIQAYVGTNSLTKSNTNLKITCKTEDDYLFNAEKIVNIFHELGLQIHLQPKDLAVPYERGNLLLLIHIFNSLAFYIPQKKPIVFSCMLGEEVAHYIELSNPFKKAVSYWVKYEGHPDFSIEEDNVRIDPGASVKFKIKFTSRISTSVSGRLTFFNKKETNAQAAALVFELCSNITSRTSIEKWNTSATLYQNKNEIIQIKNIFTNHDVGDFTITILNERVEKEDESKKRKRRKLVSGQKSSKNQKNANNSNTNAENLLNLLPPFFCSKEKIKIKKGDTAPLTIFFMPFFLENYKCKIIFSDKDVGEFQHEIFGETLMPEIIGDIRPNISLYVDTLAHFEYPIYFKNEQLAAAKKIHENRLMASGRYKESLAKFKQSTQLPDEMNYSIEISPPNTGITIPNIIRLCDSTKLGKSEKKQEKVEKLGKTTNSEFNPETSKEIASNKLPFDFSFKQPITNNISQIILKSEDKSDIRIYKLNITVAPKIVKGSLEMRCPAGEELKQQIPFANNYLDRDFLITGQITYDWHKYGAGIFSCPKELVVKRKSTGYYVLSFIPGSFHGEIEAKMVLTNKTTMDHIEYEIVGKAEEPLSKGHIVINCVARRPEKKIIELVNPYKDRAVVYEVETDLINPEGPLKFTIEPGKIYKYCLTVTPVMGGVYTGSITFYEEQDKTRYVWYTICINTDKPRSEKTIELTAVVRKTMAFEITLQNPSFEPLTYEVSIEGEGLNGEGIFIIPPQKTYTYNLFFTPLRAFKGRGSIAFIQERLGEIWYELVLISENKAPERLSTLRAELGKFAQCEVMLENPSKMEVSVFHRISNPNNFDVIPDSIIIPPMSMASAIIRYTPSDLEVNETGEVIFESEEIGHWYFMVFGVGLPPTKFEPIIMSSGLHKDLTQSINFKNPFKENINVTITLNMDKSNDVFQLLLRKNKVAVQGLAIFQIPLLFSPREIIEYHCEIVVFMNEKTQWRYPIKGITESVLNHLNYNFKVKCRETLIEDFNINLPGLPNELCKETFHLEIDHIPNEYFSLVQKSFKITAIKNTLNSIDDQLKFKVVFNPMKPFKSAIDIVVFIESGGRWKFRLSLESTDPDEDDIITIFSPINKTSSVSFKLANRFKNYAPFTAGFTSDSDSEFAIMPRSGELDPYGREGRNFVVSFTPVEYGKMKQGKLIIQTDELYWSFLIKGTFPQYKPPESQTLLNTRLDHELVEKLNVSNKKNFMMENIKRNKNVNSPERKNDIVQNNKILNTTILNKTQAKEQSTIIKRNSKMN